MDFNSSQAIPAIVFILILMTVAVWLLSLCRDGTYHCNTTKGSPIKRSYKYSPYWRHVRSVPEIYDNPSYSIDANYSPEPVYDHAPIYNESQTYNDVNLSNNSSIYDESSNDSNNSYNSSSFNIGASYREPTPSRSGRSSPGRPRSTPYFKTDKCTRSGRLY